VFFRQCCFVNGEDLVEVSLDGARFGEGARGAGCGESALRMEEFGDARGHGVGVVGVDDVSLFSMCEDFAGAVCGAGYDGERGGEGFEDDVCAGVVVAGEAEDVGGGVAGFGLRDCAEILDSVGDSEIGGEPVAGFPAAFSGDDEAEARAGLFEEGHGADERVESFALEVVSEEEDGDFVVREGEVASGGGPQAGAEVGGESAEVCAVMYDVDAVGFAPVVADDFVADEVGDGDDVVASSGAELGFFEVEDESLVEAGELLESQGEAGEGAAGGAEVVGHPCAVYAASGAEDVHVDAFSESVDDVECMAADEFFGASGEDVSAQDAAGGEGDAVEDEAFFGLVV